MAMARWNYTECCASLFVVRLYVQCLQVSGSRPRLLFGRCDIWFWQRPSRVEFDHPNGRNDGVKEDLLRSAKGEK